MPHEAPASGATPGKSTGVAGEPARANSQPYQGSVFAGAAGTVASLNPMPAGGVPGNRDTGVERQAVWVLADILQSPTRSLASAPAAYAPALRKIATAINGRGDGIERLARFEEGWAEMSPAIQYMLSPNYPEGHEYMAEHIWPAHARWIQNLHIAKATTRVDNGVVDPVVVGRIEEPDVDGPVEDMKAAGRRLASDMVKVTKTFIGAAAGELAGQMNKPEHAKARAELRKLVEEQDGLELGVVSEVFGIAGNLFTLSDEQFQKRVREIHDQPTLAKVTTFVELYKTVLELAASVTTLIIKGTGYVASLAGNVTLAARMSSLAASIGKSAGNLLAGINLVYNMLVMINPTSSDEQRLDAGVGFASSAISLAGAGPLAASIALNWMMVKVATGLYWQARVGWASWYVKQDLALLAQLTQGVVEKSDPVAVAQILLEVERDPLQRAALATVLSNQAAALGEAVDRILRRRWESPNLNKTFDLMSSYRGHRDADMALHAAARTIEKVIWCFEHADWLVEAEGKGQDVRDVEREHRRKERQTQD